MSARAVQLTGGGVVALGAAVLAVLGVGYLAYWLYQNRQLFNPADSRNVVNQAASTVVQDITGGAAAGGEDSVGGVLARLREWVSGDDAKIRAMLKGTKPDEANVITPDSPYIIIN